MNASSLCDCIKDGILRVRVTPKASAERITITSDANDERIVRVYVTCVPEDGKANAAVLKMLSKALKMPKSSLHITHGQTDRNKTIAIER